MIKFVDNSSSSSSSHKKDQDCINETHDKKSFCKCSRDYAWGPADDDDDDDDDEDSPAGVFLKCCEKHINDDCRHEMRVTGVVDDGECVKPLGKITDCALEKIEELNGSSGLRCSMILVQTVTLM